MTYSAPEGLHDDAVNSLALAVWNLNPLAHTGSKLQEELKRGNRPNQKSYI
jgi:hypothetical protein